MFQTKIKIGPVTVATLKMKEQIGNLTMLAVTNTVFQNHQHREVFLSGEQIGEENLDLSREECGKLCNKEFHSL